MDEREARLRVIEQAKSWLGTPYHTNAAVRGAGIDCIRLIQKCFVDAGVVKHFELPHYSGQWALHQTSELLVDGLLKYAREIESPGPADVVVFQVGKCWGHSSIVVDWPMIIHASPPWECRFDNVLADVKLARMTPRFFSVWDNH